MGLSNSSRASVIGGIVKKKVTKELKSVKMPDEAKIKAQTLATAKSIADIRLQSFLEGCMSGLGLKGDWNLDTNTWTFTQMPKPQEGEK